MAAARPPPSTDDIRKAERMIRSELAREPDLDDLVQETLAEASTKWAPDQGAAFASYAVTIAKHRAKDLARKRKREPVTATGELGASHAVSPWSTDQEDPKNATIRLARAVDDFIRCGELGAVLWSGPDGADSVAEYVRLHELEPLLRDHGPALRECSRTGMPLHIPPDFDARLTAYVRKTADTGNGGWVESAETRPIGRRGRPSREFALSQPAFVWISRRGELFAAIMSHALGLCGLSGRDLNRVLSPVRKAAADDTTKVVRKMRTARARLGTSDDGRKG